jgi:WhiB family redox-sensing transcriptional regulator
MVGTRVARPRPNPPSTKDESWFESAACRTADRRLFFDPEGESPKPRAARERAAKEVCAWCPVRRECLIFALATPERYGIWGGLTARERTTLKRRRRSARRVGRRGPEHRGP